MPLQRLSLFAALAEIALQAIDLGGKVIASRPRGDEVGLKGLGLIAAALDVGGAPGQLLLQLSRLSLAATDLRLQRGDLAGERLAPRAGRGDRHFEFSCRVAALLDRRIPAGKHALQIGDFRVAAVDLGVEAGDLAGERHAPLVGGADFDFESPDLGDTAVEFGDLLIALGLELGNLRLQRCRPVALAGEGAPLLGKGGGKAVALRREASLALAAGRELVAEIGDLGVAGDEFQLLFVGQLLQAAGLGWSLRRGRRCARRAVFSRSASSAAVAASLRLGRRQGVSARPLARVSSDSIVSAVFE